jgi:group I intron endonuclease
MIVYKITNKINGKVYIGKTKSNLNSRIACHKHEAKGYRTNQAIHKAIRKYGWENFTIEVVEDGIESLDFLNKQEMFYIQQYNSTNRNFGYNLTTGGDGGHGLSGDKSPLFGKKNPQVALRNSLKKGKSYAELYGEEKAQAMRLAKSLESSKRSHSEASKEKMSLKRKELWENGIYSSGEYKIKLSNRPQSRISKKKVKVFSPELNMTFESIAAAAKYINGSVGNISLVVNGKLKHYKRYTFLRVD